MSRICAPRRELAVDGAGIGAQDDRLALVAIEPLLEAHQHAQLADALVAIGQLADPLLLIAHVAQVQLEPVLVGIGGAARLLQRQPPHLGGTGGEQLGRAAVLLDPLAVAGDRLGRLADHRQVGAEAIERGLLGLRRAGVGRRRPRARQLGADRDPRPPRQLGRQSGRRLAQGQAGDRDHRVERDDLERAVGPHHQLLVGRAHRRTVRRHGHREPDVVAGAQRGIAATAGVGGRIAEHPPRAHGAERARRRRAMDGGRGVATRHRIGEQTPHERIGERIGLALGRIAGLAHGQAVARRRRPTRLDRVGDLVGDQPLAVGPARVVGPVAEEHVLAERERAGADRARRGVGVAAGVDAHVVERRPERRLERGPQAGLERGAATAARALDQRGGVGVDLGGLGAAHHPRRQHRRQRQPPRGPARRRRPLRTALALVTVGHRARLRPRLQPAASAPLEDRLRLLLDALVALVHAAATASPPLDHRHRRTS